MKYSIYDLILVAISIFQGLTLVFWALNFNDLNLMMHFSLLVFVVFCSYYNPIVVTHNFLHTSFFKNPKLNICFSILNSMSMGLPTIIYKYHHLNHHRFNNSLEDPSSTFLFGKNNQQEHWFKYSAMSIFRDGTQRAFVLAMQKGETFQLAIECLATIAFWAILTLINWKFFVVCYIPLWLFGWFLAHIENYFEHYKATDPANRFSNSVSIYSRWYNFLMFNEGYHQEHHLSPQEHWTKRPQTYEKFSKRMEEAGAYKAKWPPLLGMLE